MTVDTVDMLSKYKRPLEDVFGTYLDNILTSKSVALVLLTTQHFLLSNNRRRQQNMLSDSCFNGRSNSTYSRLTECSPSAKDGLKVSFGLTYRQHLVFFSFVPSGLWNATFFFPLFNCFTLFLIYK